MIGQPLRANAILIPETTGAIVGEATGAPQLAMTFDAGNYLTTGTLTAGQSGDVQGLSDWSGECWFQVHLSQPSATRDILRGPTSNTGQVMWRIGHTTTGQVQAQIITTVSTYTATSAALLQLERWHHVCGVFTGSNLLVYVDGVQVASTAATGTFLGLDPPGTGSPEMRVGDSASTTFVRIDEVAVYRTELSAARVLAHYEAGAERGFVSSLSGARINAVLDAVGSHAPRRVGAGARTAAPRYMVGQAPLDEIRSARSVDAVDAILFTARDGTLVFLDADHRASSPYNTVQATFDDDGTDLPYENLEFDYSDSFIVNEWNVTRDGTDAVTQSVSDTASISEFGHRPQSITGFPVTTDGQALTIATAMLAKYKDPLERVTSLTLTTQVPDVAEAALKRDLGDRIRVLHTVPGGGTRIDQTLFIQRIEEAGANDMKPWTIRWGLSPV